MIKYLVMDVDGTLTDGKIYISDSGELCKAFSIKDGCGIHDLLLPAGILPVIITGRKSKIVENRCKEIGITEIHQGVTDKIGKLKSIATDLTQVAYIGDDLNDLVCIKEVQASGGIVGCPCDAAKQVLKTADFIAEHKGGDGAVRDFIEWILQKKE